MLIIEETPLFCQCMTKSIVMQDPDLFKQLNQSMSEVAKIAPLNDNIEEVLKTFYSFDTPAVRPYSVSENTLVIANLPCSTPKQPLHPINFSAQRGGARHQAQLLETDTTAHACNTHCMQMRLTSHGCVGMFVLSAKAPFDTKHTLGSQPPASFLVQNPSLCSVLLDTLLPLCHNLLSLPGHWCTCNQAQTRPQVQSFIGSQAQTCYHLFCFLCGLQRVKAFYCEVIWLSAWVFVLCHHNANRGGRLFLPIPLCFLAGYAQEGR